MSSDRGSNGWYVLVLSTLTMGLAYAMPTMCLPVLFKEISRDFSLNLVQAGVVWGTTSLAGLAACLIGGIVGDKFGLKRTLTVVCFLSAVTGAARGLSNSWISLSATSLIYSFVSSIITINTPKVSRIWFANRHFGLSNGIAATGMSLGFTLGALISATVLSPWLGGWRNVLYFYGVLTLIAGALWLFTVHEPRNIRSAGAASAPPVWQSLKHVSGIRGVWLLGFALAGFVGCTQGVTGYLSLNLQNIGWSPAAADGALGALNIASAFGPVPMSLLSDRIGRRKTIMLLLVAVFFVGTLLLAFYHNGMVWVLAVMIGLSRDAVMTLFVIMVMELKGVELVYAGTAIGLLQTISRVGGAVAPPIGNGLAGISAGTPYLFWAGLAALGLVILAFARDTGPKAGTVLSEPGAG